jgi:CO/xanthine dehydrogenase Mo-binding subunit
MPQSGGTRRPKGASEAGNVGALAGIMNAVVDALSPLGIAHTDLPATPEKVWRTIRVAQGRIDLRPRAVPTPA